jgi:hypothetical protein
MYVCTQVPGKMAGSRCRFSAKRPQATGKMRCGHYGSNGGADQARQVKVCMMGTLMLQKLSIAGVDRRRRSAALLSVPTKSVEELTTTMLETDYRKSRTFGLIEELSERCGPAEMICERGLKRGGGGLGLTAAWVPTTNALGALVLNDR